MDPEVSLPAAEVQMALSYSSLIPSRDADDTVLLVENGTDYFYPLKGDSVASSGLAGCSDGRRR